MLGPGTCTSSPARASTDFERTHGRREHPFFHAGLNLRLSHVGNPALCPAWLNRLGGSSRWHFLTIRCSARMSMRTSKEKILFRGPSFCTGGSAECPHSPCIYTPRRWKYPNRFRRFLKCRWWTLNLKCGLGGIVTSNIKSNEHLTSVVYSTFRLKTQNRKPIAMLHILKLVLTWEHRPPRPSSSNDVTRTSTVCYLGTCD